MCAATSVSSAASPGGGSTALLGGVVVAQRADELVDLATVSRATSSIVSSAARDRVGSCSCSRRAAPACTRITLIAWPAESCRSRAIRVRSSAGRQAALALRLPLGAQRALLELGQLLAA